MLAAIALNDVFSGSGSPEGFGEIGKELVDYLSTRYLETYHPFAFHLLYLLTVIDDFPAPLVDQNGTQRACPPSARAGSLRTWS